MKVVLAEAEWYPVYVLSENGWRDVELDDAVLQRYKAALAEWEDVQDLLERAWAAGDER